MNNIESIIEKHTKSSRINKNGVLVEIGKTYYYYNQGLGEIKTHTVKYFSNPYAVDSDGKVLVDSLFLNKEDVLTTTGESL